MSGLNVSAAVSAGYGGYIAFEIHHVRWWVYTGAALSRAFAHRGHRKVADMFVANEVHFGRVISGFTVLDWFSMHLAQPHQRDTESSPLHLQSDPGPGE